MSIGKDIFISDPQAVHAPSVEDVASRLVVVENDELMCSIPWMGQGDLKRPVEFQVRAFLTGMPLTVHGKNFFGIREADTGGKGGIEEAVPGKIAPPDRHRCVVIEKGASRAFIDDAERQVHLQLRRIRVVADPHWEYMEGVIEGEEVDSSAGVSLRKGPLSLKQLTDPLFGDHRNADLESPPAEFVRNRGCPVRFRLERTRGRNCRLITGQIDFGDCEEGREKKEGESNLKKHGISVETDEPAFPSPSVKGVLRTRPDLIINLSNIMS